MPTTEADRTTIAACSERLASFRLKVKFLEDGVEYTRLDRRLECVDKWQEGWTLGVSNFSKVYVETCVEKPTRVRVVKRLVRDNRNCYQRELEAAALFSQEKYDGIFVDFLGWYETDTLVYLAMEYLPLGDLENYMNHAFPEVEARTIIRQIIVGLDFMHDKDVIHRDIKPQNILVCRLGPDWLVKLADFGLSKRAQAGDETLRTIAYTLGFVAPEVFFLSSYTRAVDLWSTGIIAYLLLTYRTKVFYDNELFRYYQKSFGFPLHPLTSCAVSQLGQDFIKSLLAPNFEDRPAAPACLQHEWLTIDDSALQSGKLPISLSKQKMVRQSAEGGFLPWTTLQNDATSLPQAPSLYDERIIEQTRSSEALEASKVETPPRSMIESRTLPASPAVPVTSPRDVERTIIAEPTGETVEKGETLYFDAMSWTSSFTSLESKREGEYVLRGHDDVVSTIVFSSNGRSVATGSRDGTARIWNVSNSATDYTLASPSGAVRAIAYSPDDEFLAACSIDATARIYDLVHRPEIWRLRGHTRSVWNIAFSPDQRLVATVSDDMTARLWNASDHDDGHLTPPLWNISDHDDSDLLRGHRGPVWGLDFSPDGRILATGSDDTTIRCWDMTTAKVRQRFMEHSKGVRSVAFSPNGYLVASASHDNTARVWDLRSGQTVRHLRGHGYFVVGVTFSPDGRTLATASYDGTARLWDVTSGAELRRLVVPTARVEALAYSPDGRKLAVALNDKTARLWTFEEMQSDVVSHGIIINEF